MSLAIALIFLLVALDNGFFFGYSLGRRFPGKRLPKFFRENSYFSLGKALAAS
jgi:uncharacterized protein YneF (UPF0154 family)